MSRYVVGIDLGTTNSALAYADTQDATPDAPPADPVAADPAGRRPSSDVGERPVLPSFLYLPAAKEFPAGALDLPWRRGPTASSARSRATTGRRCPAGWSARPRAGSRTRASTARARSCPGTRPSDVDEGLARRGLDGLPRPPPRRLEPPDRRQDRRRPARAAGRPPDRPRLVRRRRPRADRRGRPRGRPGEGDPARGAPGRLLRLARPRRATAGGSRSRSATSCSSATSAAARPTSP